MLTLYLASEESQLLFAILEDLACFCAVPFGLLELREDLFHGQKFGAFRDIDIEDQRVNADHLLVET